MAISHVQESEKLIKEVANLSMSAWGNRIGRADIDAWLLNFQGALFDVDYERQLALRLLRNFCLFGLPEVRVLLRAIFRDLFSYPIKQDIRSSLGSGFTNARAQREFQRELAATRFLGIGNPSESGAHLLYYFRQENRIHKDLFIDQNQILTGPIREATTTFRPGVKRLVFIDDILGSGQQVTEYSATLLGDLRSISTRTRNPVEFHYYSLFARRAGLNIARATDFTTVEAVHELADSEEAFHIESRVFSGDATDTQRTDAKKIAQHYGRLIFGGGPLGYGNSQLLLGFPHNVPDNSLPIFWVDEPSLNWQAIFPRYVKEF